MVEPEYQENVPISPLGTPFSSIHSYTHYLQMTELHYVNSSTTLEFQIKNDNRYINPQLPEYQHVKQNRYRIMHQPSTCREICGNLTGGTSLHILDESVIQYQKQNVARMLLPYSEYTYNRVNLLIYPPSPHSAAQCKHDITKG